MTETQFWWATIGEGEPEVVNVRFDDGKPAHVFSTGPEFDFEAREFEDLRLRLIERVLPAGRAAAVVARLQDAWNDQACPGPADDIAEAIEFLQGAEIRA